MGEAATNETVEGTKNSAIEPTNKLIGWLVSFSEDRNGRAIEIRSGKLFVTGQPLGLAGEMILADKSVSAPHLAVKATSDGHFFVQDIFSESGTYVTRSGETREESVQGVVELFHGDYLRIGKKIRYQICLIDGN